MFVVILTYKKPLEIINMHLTMHRKFLDEGYKNNYFVVSGPMNPRTGGIIISQVKSKEKLEVILKEDPFYLHEVAEYKIIDFSPTKYQPQFSKFIE